ncbi:MAG TPA: plasmid maintenance system killer [Alphaproteobacteria bacterium]|nr:plasmid maintenance system killer [Alphaproteobacteria bacterium]
MPIRSFKDKRAEAIWNLEQVKSVSTDLQRQALKKPRMLNNSKTLNDLKIPPSNHLEKLLGDRKNFYSIRVNIQWRIVFKFDDGDFYDVEFIDYH